MIDTISAILEALESDIVSNGFLVQLIRNAEGDMPPSQERIRQVLIMLLSKGCVEIGNARIAGPDYVEFIAWNGNSHARITRAMNAVSTTNDNEKEFAFWLCMRKNIDRFEGGGLS